MAPALLRHIVGIALAVAAVLVLVNQCRKPSGWPGQLVLRIMNARHAGVTDWGLGQVRPEKHFTILDAGCGGGRTIAKLAAIATEGRVYGIDYSRASVAAARRLNAPEIEAGRVAIERSHATSALFVARVAPWPHWDRGSITPPAPRR